MDSRQYGPNLGCAEQTFHMDRILLKSPAQHIHRVSEIDLSTILGIDHLLLKDSYQKEGATWWTVTCNSLHRGSILFFVEAYTWPEGWRKRWRWTLTGVCFFFPQGTFFFQWLNPYLVPAVDFLFLPNEINEEWQVNIPSRNPLKSENMCWEGQLIQESRSQSRVTVPSRHTLPPGGPV